MKRAGKSFLFLIGLSLLFPCCKKKGGETSPQYLRFTLNGSRIECDNKFYASPKLTVGLDANISFYARWGDNELDLQLFSYNADITPGQYVFGPNKAYSAVVWPNGTASQPGIHYSYIAGSSVPVASIEGSGQITITEIDGSHIRGSFDCVTGINAQTGLSMTLTGGEFNINR